VWQKPNVARHSKSRHVPDGEFNGIIPERLSVCSERFCDSGCNCFHFNVASTSLQRNIVTKQAIKKTVFAGTR